MKGLLLSSTSFYPDYFTAFDDSFIMDVLADSVRYTDKIIKAMVVYAQQNVNIQDSYLNAPQITVTALKKDVPGVTRGSTFQHNGKVLTVDAPVNDTETHITLAVNYD